LISITKSYGIAALLHTRSATRTIGLSQIGPPSSSGGRRSPAAIRWLSGGHPGADQRSDVACRDVGRVARTLLPGGPKACFGRALPRFVFSLLLGPCQGRYGQRVFRAGIHRLAFERFAQGVGCRRSAEAASRSNGRAVFRRVREPVASS
jgi:hypothetical protein